MKKTTQIFIMLFGLLLLFGCHKNDNPVSTKNNSQNAPQIILAQRGDSLLGQNSYWWLSYHSNIINHWTIINVASVPVHNVFMTYVDTFTIDHYGPAIDTVGTLMPNDSATGECFNYWRLTVTWNDIYENKIDTLKGY